MLADVKLSPSSPSSSLFLLSLSSSPSSSSLSRSASFAQAFHNDGDDGKNGDGDDDDDGSGDAAAAASLLGAITSEIKVLLLERASHVADAKSLRAEAAGLRSRQKEDQARWTTAEQVRRRTRGVFVYLLFFVCSCLHRPFFRETASKQVCMHDRAAGCAVGLCDNIERLPLLYGRDGRIGGRVCVRRTRSG